MTADFNHFIQQLKKKLSEKLPGEEAQLKMAPVQRKALIEYYKAGLKDAKQSAVLVCLYPHKNSIYTALMLRPSEQGAHSGQVSFPGGKFEEEDESLQFTALREANEEVGINSSSIEVVGSLTPVYIPVSNFVVNPFLGITFKRPLFSINQNEVKKIIEAEISFVVNQSLKGRTIFKSGGRFDIEAPYYEVQQHKIWGATAMILSELENILTPILTSK